MLKIFCVFHFHSLRRLQNFFSNEKYSELWYTSYSCGYWGLFLVGAHLYMEIKCIKGHCWQWANYLCYLFLIHLTWRFRLQPLNLYMYYPFVYLACGVHALCTSHALCLYTCAQKVCVDIQVLFKFHRLPHPKSGWFFTTSSLRESIPCNSSNLQPTFRTFPSSFTSCLPLPPFHESAILMHTLRWCPTILGSFTHIC